MNDETILHLAREAGLIFNQHLGNEAARELHFGRVKRFAQLVAAAEQGPKCNPHPKAPHGFDRNASHSSDRYVCECEGWDAYEAGKMEGIKLTLDEWGESEPPQPKREPLTDELRNWIVATCPTPRHIIDAVERMHCIKG